MKTFYLVDGHAQIFRCYYAPFGALSSPSGEPTKATFLFTQMMINFLLNEKPDFIAVALDFDDETTERKAFYPEYKANRDAAPDDLHPQVERICEILQLMEIPIFSIQGQEADDVIATIAARLADEDVQVRVISKDKDLHQILSDRVVMWDHSGSGLVLDPRILEEKMGYTPGQAVEIQTLTGDSIDNVPGVPGIGPKKAAGLLQKYGTIEGVLANADALTPKMRENILASKEGFDLTRSLVTLKRDVELDFDLEECRAKPVPLERLRPLFQDLGLRRLLETLEKASSQPTVAASASPGAAAQSSSLSRAVEGQYRLVNTPDAFGELMGALGDVKRFAIDTETTSLHAIDSLLVGLSFSWKAGQGCYVALRSSWGETLDVDSTLAALKPILEDPGIEKCGQNIKFDHVVLRNAGIFMRGVVFDAMVASYLLMPERRSHGMDALARDLLGHETIPITSLIGKGKEQISMMEVDLERLAQYAGEDADITWRLQEELAPRIAESPVRDLFEQVEMPLVEVLADLEFNGVALDRDVLGAIQKDFRQRLAELRDQIHREAGHEFNIDSPRQLAEVLFDELGLRVVKKTKTSRSTDASVLQTLAIETASPLPGLVLEYRELAKLLGTYVEPLPGMISPRTGRLHASFHQTVAATGRLSSSDPNLQNIPIRTEQGREIRRAFVPGSPDNVLLTADYSQIELRILAHLSQDPALIEAFRADQDIHTFVAAQIAGVPAAEVTREMRTRAKAVNFGIIYGQGPLGLARSLRIGRGEAAAFIRDYKKRYPGIPRFMEQCIREAQERGGVTTMLGRFRPIPEIHSSGRAVQAQGERLAINTVVQGSAADMIKQAMVRIHRRVRDGAIDLRMLIQVHDELVFETPRALVEEHAHLVREEMAGALPLDVPVVVDVAWGENWLEGK